MKKIILFLGIIIFATSCSNTEKGNSNSTVSTETANSGDSDWKERYGYTLGYQAYLYGYPLVKLSELRYDWVTNPKASFYAPLNFFHNKKELANHKNYTTGGSPNQDTQYSWGWMDLKNGPVILTHPDMGDRYFVFEIADMFSDNFAYVGKRTTGGKAGAFAIIPPNWKGQLPKNITGSFQSPTNSVLIFGRTFVQDEADVPTVNALQEQFHMIPLEYWGKDLSTLPINRNVIKPYDRNTDDLADWKTMIAVWKENPIERDSDLKKLFAYIGIGPEFNPEDIDKIDESIKKGLIRAAKDARKDLDGIYNTGGFKPSIKNGWSYPPMAFGRLGLVYDFPTRASIQCEKGIISNDPIEATYLNTPKDSKGELLNGNNKYEIRYTKETLPQVKEFYSLTIYKMDGNFVPNDIMRYSIGDRTKGIKKSADGSYTVYVQADEPKDPDKRANWLPSPSGDVGFYFVLRTYGPEKSVVDQTWTPPAIVKVE